VLKLLRNLAISAILPALISGALLTSGCTGPVEYVHNGFKVGPNYHPPSAMIAEHWIDVNDRRVRSECDDLATWWTVMNDPLLNQMMVYAYQQNLTLREAGFRVLEARANYAIAVGEFFPQTQTFNGSYRRFGVGQNFFNQWNTNFNLGWELDFWGRFRRAIQSADDALDASVFNYDDALVTLLGDVATNYVEARTDQEQIKLLEKAVRIQTDVYNFIAERLKVGFHGVTELDRAQAESDLKQSIAQISVFKIDLRISENALCVLLGIPIVDLEPLMASAPNTEIPKVPDSVVVGVPADLLRRRPDVRAAERNAAAQAEQIGIAEAAMYPTFSINGTLGWQAASFSDLFSPQALNSNVGPSFTWNVLNYGRILNNVRLQDATFQQLVATYQQTVLVADQEVENGIVTFLQNQDRVRNLQDSVDAAYRALVVIIAQYENPVQNVNVDFNRYAVILENLITQQEAWAQARGQVDQGLIETYRALGGGWQIRLQLPASNGPGVVPPPVGQDQPPPQLENVPGKPAENLPAPLPEPMPVPLPKT
jgi:NodT family efflux transporter outer membrane factor (OMF) lipoprotein